MGQPSQSSCAVRVTKGRPPVSGHARSGPETVVTIIFEERDGKTLMTFRQGAFDTQENCDGHRTGWNSAFDRLEEYVAKV